MRSSMTRPAVQAVAHIRGDALFARQVDENGNEAVITIAMD
jgi:hypothetical protein